MADRKTDVIKVPDAIAQAAEHRIAPWNGSPRQGAIQKVDDETYAMSVGRGVYVTFDLEKDLRGVVPPLGVTASIARNGTVAPVEALHVAHDLGR